MRKQILLLATAGTTGLLVYLLLRKRQSHRKWKRRRGEIIARARRLSTHGEFVL